MWRILARLPWGTRLAAVILGPVVTAGPVLLSSGVGARDASQAASIMSGGWLVFAWVVATPLVVMEFRASRTYRLRRSRLWGAAAVGVLVAVAVLPVVFRLGPAGPVDPKYLWMAVTSYVVLLLGYLVGTVAACVLLSARSGEV